jgi:hypothetical protein
VYHHGLVNLFSISSKLKPYLITRLQFLGLKKEAENFNFIQFFKIPLDNVEDDFDYLYYV